MNEIKKENPLETNDVLVLNDDTLKKVESEIKKLFPSLCFEIEASEETRIILTFNYQNRGFVINIWKEEKNLEGIINQKPYKVMPFEISKDDPEKRDWLINMSNDFTEKKFLTGLKTIIEEIIASVL